MANQMIELLELAMEAASYYKKTTGFTLTVWSKADLVKVLKKVPS